MDNQERLILEIKKQAEVRLAALQQIVLAADARAMQFAGVCAAASAVLAAIGTKQDYWVSSISAAAIFFAAAARALWSARPSGWNAAGFTPSDFKEDVDNNRPVHEVYLDMLGVYDDMIAHNLQIMKDNGKVMRDAVYLAISAPLVGLIGQLGGLLVSY